MGTVAAIGEQVRVAGLALAGVAVLPAEDAGAVRSAWAALPDRVELVLLTAAAAAALGPAAAGERPLTAVLPEGGGGRTGAASSDGPGEAGEQPAGRAADPGRPR